MRRHLLRLALMAVLSAAVLGLFIRAASAASAVSLPQFVLAGTVVVFGFTVLRLSQQMFAASVERRRAARRGLIFAAAVPVLVLVPAAIISAPRELMPALLIGGAMWLALAMACTSFFLARATAADRRGNASLVTPIERYTRARSAHLQARRHVQRHRGRRPAVGHR